MCIHPITPNPMTMHIASPGEPGMLLGKETEPLSFLHMCNYSSHPHGIPGSLISHSTLALKYFKL